MHLSNIIYKTILLLLPFLIIFVISEILLRNVPNAYSYKDDYLVKHGNKIDTLILGNSQAYFGINPSYMKGNPFSLANVSQNIAYDDWLLSKYIDNMSNLRYVIVTVSDFSLVVDALLEHWRDKYYRIYFGKDDYFPIKYNFEAMQPLKSIVTDIYNYYYLNHTPKDYSNLGFGLSYTFQSRRKDLEKDGPIAAKRHSVTINNDVVDTNINHIIDIILNCQRKGIKVILITPPVHKSCFKFLDNKQLALTKTTCEKLSQKYHIQYYYLMEDPRFEDSDFWDSDHLNQYGARKLSGIISMHLNALPR